MSSDPVPTWPVVISLDMIGAVYVCIVTLGGMAMTHSLMVPEPGIFEVTVIDSENNKSI